MPLQNTHGVFRPDVRDTPVLEGALSLAGCYGAWRLQEIMAFLGRFILAR
jgi:hypothetical protein